MRIFLFPLVIVHLPIRRVYNPILIQPGTISPPKPPVPDTANAMHIFHDQIPKPQREI